VPNEQNNGKVFIPKSSRKYFTFFLMAENATRPGNRNARRGNEGVLSMKKRNYPLWEKREKTINGPE
jgi:hypothetical protein